MLSTESTGRPPEGPARVTLLTREYPPNVYGGAGVHVTYLARELARRMPVEVRAFGRPGRRELLWQIPDSGVQLAARALMLLALVAAIGMRISGTFPRLP